MSRNKQKFQQKGFTLIELLVVISIIALLASVVLMALQSARQKSRDAKRLSDMTQMNTYLELYFTEYKGYPGDNDSNGIPDDLAPKFITRVPTSPLPADTAVCENNHTPCGGANQPACVSANRS